MAGNRNILPAAKDNQKYVEVSPIPGGFITLPDRFFIHPADPEAKRTVPSLTFLVKHPGTSAFGADPSDHVSNWSLTASAVPPPTEPMSR